MRIIILRYVVDLCSGFKCPILEVNAGLLKLLNISPLKNEHMYTAATCSIVTPDAIFNNRLHRKQLMYQDGVKWKSILLLMQILSELLLKINGAETRACWTSNKSQEIPGATREVSANTSL